MNYYISAGPLTSAHWAQAVQENPDLVGSWLPFPPDQAGGTPVIVFPPGTTSEQIVTAQSVVDNPPVLTNQTIAQATDSYLHCLSLYNTIPAPPPSGEPDVWALARARRKACLDANYQAMINAGGPA